MSKQDHGTRRAEQRTSKEEDIERRRAEALAAAGGIIKEDCPCPKKKCVNYGLCAPCREKHQNSPPYCERKPR